MGCHTKVSTMNAKVVPINMTPIIRLNILYHFFITINNLYSFQKYIKNCFISFILKIRLLYLDV